MDEIEESLGVFHVDISDLVEKTCQRMEIGELLASPAFDLAQSVSALEIGDPKMDVGYHRSEAKSVAEYVAAGEAPVQLSKSDLLSIFDRLLQLEVCWQERFMLPQTVYTSLYMMDMERLREQNKILYSYCRALHTTCSFLHQLVYDGEVCYDEDVSMVSFGVTFDDVNEKMVLDEIEQIGKIISSLPTMDDDIRSRIEFRRNLLEIWHGMLASDVDVIIFHSNAAIQNLEFICKNSIHEERLERAVGFVYKLHDAAIGPSPKRELEVIPFKEAIMKWSAILQSIHKASAWIAKVQSWKELRDGLDLFAAEDAHAFVRSLVHRLIVPKKAGIPASWHPTKEMIGKAAYVYQSEDIFQGALSQFPDLKLFFDQCEIAVRGWCYLKCLNKCRQRRRLRHLISDWKNMCDHAYNAEMNPDVRAWFESLGWKWNPELDSKVTADDRLAPLTSWVVQEACWSCVDHILLGSTLNLYQEEELASVYWYASYILDYMDLMGREFDNLSMQLRLSAAASPVQKKKKKNAVLRQMAPKCDLSNLHVAPPQGPLQDAWVQRKFRVLVCMMCEAISRGCLALKHAGLLPRMKHLYNTPKEQFDQRFEFMKILIIPEYLSFSNLMEFEAASLKTVCEDGTTYFEPDSSASEGLLERAIEIFRLCDMFRQSFSIPDRKCYNGLSPSQKAQIDGMQRVLSANSTALMLVSNLVRRNNGDASAVASQFIASFSFDPKPLPVLVFPIFSLQRHSQGASTKK